MLRQAERLHARAFAKTQSGRIPAANSNSTVPFRTVLLFAGGYRRFWVSARKCGKQGGRDAGKPALLPAGRPRGAAKKQTPRVGNGGVVRIRCRRTEKSGGSAVPQPECAAA